VPSKAAILLLAASGVTRNKDWKIIPVWEHKKALFFIVPANL
jgi:hypothetical protein